MTEYTEEDKVRVFMGSIPSTANNEDVQSFLGEHGWDDLHVNLLTDKRTGNKKGCGFVAFPCKAEAEKAISQFDGAITYPGMSRTIVMKVADCDLDKLDWRVFIARIPRSFTDNAELQDRFDTFGTVISCNILRDRNGESKGAGFVQFMKRSEALGCIERGQNLMVPGSKGPLVVRMVESNKEKEERKQAKSQPPMLGMGGANGPSGNSSMMYPPMQPPMGPPQMGGAGNPSPMAPPLSAPPTPPPMGNPMLPMHSGADPIPLPPQPTPYGSGNMQNPLLPVPPAQPGMVPGAQPGMMLGAQPGMMAPGFPLPSPYGGPPQEKSTLFVYGIPPVWTERDLEANFCYFGAVRDAKVGKNPSTGESKGYGFVSFDSRVEAQQAILSMNGLQVGPSRLTVSFKTDKKKAGAPY